MMKGFDPARGKWIPWTFAGMMALVVAVNGGLIFAAVSTFTGTTMGHAYDKGRVYNDVIAEAARQAALGWAPRVALAPGRLLVSVQDREGLPVPGHLAGVLQRPLDGREVSLEFRETTPGHWRAEVTPPDSGQWEARLRLSQAPDRHLDIRQRVMAP